MLISYFPTPSAFVLGVFYRKENLFFLPFVHLIVIISVY